MGTGGHGEGPKVLANRHVHIIRGKKIQLIPLARAKGLAEVNVSANLDTGGHGQGPKALTGMHVHIIRGKHLWIIQPQSVAKSLT